MTFPRRRRDADWLRGIDLFRACTDRELAIVDQLTTTIDVSPGTVICRQGRPGQESFVVVAGEAAVAVDGATIASVGPGSFFGEMSVLDHAPRVATVTALTPMTLLASTGQELERLIVEVPPVGRHMLGAMSGRLRTADQALAGARSE